MPSGSMAGCWWKRGSRGGKGTATLYLPGGNTGRLCIICGGKCGMYGGARKGEGQGPGVLAGGCRWGKPDREAGMVKTVPIWLTIRMERRISFALLSSSFPAELKVERCSKTYSGRALEVMFSNLLKWLTWWQHCPLNLHVHESSFCRMHGCRGHDSASSEARRTPDGCCLIKGLCQRQRGDRGQRCTISLILGWNQITKRSN